MGQVRTLPGYLLRRAHQISMAVFADEMSDMDLTAAQLIAIIAVNENAGIDATRLTDMIYFDKATVGGVVERLERKGLIRRTPHASDKRVKLLQVTPAGRAMMTVSEGRVQAVQTRLLHALSEEERAELARLLSKIVSSFAVDEKD